MIHRTAPEAEYYFKEGCHILELWNDPADPEVSVARARVAPGVATRCHWLMHTTERYVLLSGEGEVMVGDTGPIRVHPGSVVLITAGRRHWIRNTGTEDLVFLAICSPRFQASNYCEGDS